MAVIGHHRERRRKRGERLHRGARPRKLFPIKGERAVKVEHRDEALVEAPLLDRDFGSVLRLDGKGVERLPVDALERGDRIGADALMRLRVDLLQMRIARTHRKHALLRQRHHLGAAGHDEILEAGLHRGSRDVRGRDARAAEAVKGDAARLHVVAGVERRHPADVAGLFHDLRTRPPHDIVDVGGVEFVSLLQRFEHGRTEVLGVEVGKRTLALLPDPSRGSAGVDDVGLRHLARLSRRRAGHHSAVVVDEPGRAETNGDEQSHLAVEWAVGDQRVGLHGSDIVERGE